MSSTIFENTVTLNSNSASCVPSAGDCYTTGSTLADLNVSAANSIRWYNAATGGSILPGFYNPY